LAAEETRSARATNEAAQWKAAYEGRANGSSQKVESGVGCDLN
jgi:hypothetical protein